MISTQRFQRQADLVPLKKLGSIRASVVGVGAVGRQVALQLAAIGCPRIQLVDFDQVEYSNVTTQGYRQASVGDDKVLATRFDIGCLDKSIEVETICDRYRARLDTGNALFCCVDSISIREAIWRGRQQQVRAGRLFWADGRMLGEVIRVLAAADPSGATHYPTTLFAQAEVQAGRCTARSTIYAASIAAGLMIHQFTRWLRLLPLDADTTLNLLSGEWSVAAN